MRPAKHRNPGSINPNMPSASLEEHNQLFPAPASTVLRPTMSSSSRGTKNNSSGERMKNSLVSKEMHNSQESLASTASGSSTWSIDSEMEPRQRSRKPRKIANFRSEGNSSIRQPNREARRFGATGSARNRSSSAHKGRTDSGNSSSGNGASSNENISSNRGCYSEYTRDLRSNGSRNAMNNLDTSAFPLGRLPPLHMPPPPLPSAADGLNHFQGSTAAWPHRRNSWSSFRDNQMTHTDRANSYGHSNQQSRPNRGNIRSHSMDVCGGSERYNQPRTQSHAATHENESSQPSAMRCTETEDPLIPQLNNQQHSSFKKRNSKDVINKQRNKSIERQTGTEPQTSATANQEQKINGHNGNVKEEDKNCVQSEHKKPPQSEISDSVQENSDGLSNPPVTLGSQASNVLSTDVITDADSRVSQIRDPVTNRMWRSRFSHGYFGNPYRHEIRESLSNETTPTQGSVNNNGSNVASREGRRTSTQLLRSQIEEEMARARQMDIPVNLDRDRREQIESSNLNPEASVFSPTLEDGNGNEFVMVQSSNGMVYFHPRTPNNRSNPAYVVPTSIEGRSRTGEMVVQKNEESDDENGATAAFNSLSLQANYDPTSHNAILADSQLTEEQRPSQTSNEISTTRVSVLPSASNMIPSCFLTPQEPHIPTSNNGSTNLAPLSIPATVYQNGTNSDNDCVQYPQMLPTPQSNHFPHFPPAPHQLPGVHVFPHPQPHLGFSPAFCNQEAMITAHNVNANPPPQTFYQHPHYQQHPLPIAVPHPNVPPLVSLHPFTPIGFVPPPNSPLTPMSDQSGVVSPFSAPHSPFTPPIMYGYGQPTQSIPHVGPQPPIMSLQAYWATMDNNPSESIFSADKTFPPFDGSTSLKFAGEDCDSCDLQSKNKNSRPNATSSKKIVHEDEQFALKVITKFVKAVKNCEKTSESPLSESEIIGRLLEQTTGSLFGVESQYIVNSNSSGTNESEDDPTDAAMETGSQADGSSHLRDKKSSESEPSSQTSEESEGI